MNRTTILAALFAVSLAAGVWVFRPSPPAPGSAPQESCTSEKSCEAVPAAGSDASVATSPDAATVADPPAEPSRVEVPPAPSDEPRAATPPASAPDGKALRAEADRLLAEGHGLEGIEKLREATKADPTPKNHGDLGDLLQRMTAIDAALVHLRAAAELDPGNADRWIALANAYYQAVDPGEAWKAEKRAREAEPGLVLGRDKNGRRVRQGDSEPRKP